ncbi:MAG: hypothetical protein LBS88_10210 [Tannerellaceae bacterium]|jgi:hypothetical protein|nr:hypothetical protein [Tannerellaceae bacterium]
MKNCIFPRPLLSLWLAYCTLTASFAQTEEPFRERLCLQTDKDIYIAGEFVWLKAIAKDVNGRPSDLSKVGYVELLDDSAPQVQIKLGLENGVGEGSFSLPLTLPTGHYRLVGYTRYMRNEGEAVYYDHLLPVINPFIPLRASSATSSVATSSVPPEASAVLPSLSTDRDVDLNTLSVSITGIDSLLVWVKSVPTDANDSLSDLGKADYAELSDDSTPQVQIKLELENGVGEGSFFLPLTLPSGHYRLVTQTRNRSNEGETTHYAPLLPVINPSSSISPSVFTDRVVYSPRTTGELRIEGLPEDLHTLSVSIAGIDSLTPAVTGNENYQRPLAGQTLLPGEQEYAEYEGHIITGRLIDLATGSIAAPVEKPTALLGFVGSRTRLFGGQVSGQGEVYFFTPKNDGINEVSTTVLPSPSQQYRVDIQSPFARHTYAPLPDLPLYPAGNQALLRRSVGMQVLQTYTAEADSTSLTNDGEALFSLGEPDWRYLLDEYTRFGTMEEMIIEFIPGLRFRKTDNSYFLSVLTEERAGFTQAQSLVLLDGIPLIDHGLIYNYNPLLIKEIEVYKGKYVFGGAVFDGLAIFKTYRNDYPGLRLNGSTQLFSYEGMQLPRRFHAPAYRTEKERESRLPDYRHTLLWKPQVETYPGHKLIPFTTSDIKGDFRIIVEGLTQNGRRIYATGFIRVE